MRRLQDAFGSRWFLSGSAAEMQHEAARTSGRTSADSDRSSRCALCRCTGKCRRAGDRQIQPSPQDLRRARRRGAKTSTFRPCSTLRLPHPFPPRLPEHRRCCCACESGHSRNAQTDGGTEGGSQGGSGLTTLEIGDRIAAAYPAYYGEGGHATAKWRNSCVRMPVRNVTDMCHRRTRG